MTIKSQAESRGQGADINELKVMFHFSHGSSEVFCVDADAAYVQPETWTGERNLSVFERGKKFRFVGELVLERTRTTDGIWETFYYVKVAKPLPDFDNPQLLTIEKVGEQ